MVKLNWTLLIMNIDDSALDFGAEERLPKDKKKLPHPLTCLAHLGFRTSALVVYMFGNAFSSSGFISIFICILLLLCIDFWVVKNITGRLLVGLRWWNKVSEQGENVWIYESRKPTSRIKNHPFETKWVLVFLALHLIFRFISGQLLLRSEWYQPFPEVLARMSF